MHRPLESLGSATKAYLPEQSGHSKAADLAVVVEEALVTERENILGPQYVQQVLLLILFLGI
jgi:hypothetical protein